VAHGLAIDDADVTITCYIINCVLQTVKTAGGIVQVFVVFGLHGQSEQLQTSPATTRDHQEVCTVEEIARRPTSCLRVLLCWLVAIINRSSNYQCQ